MVRTWKKKGCIRAVMAEGMGRHMLFVLQLHGGEADVEALNYHGCVQFPLCWHTNNSKTLLSVAPENRNSNGIDKNVMTLW